MAEIDEAQTIDRIKSHKSVQGMVIVNNDDGKVVRSSYINKEKKEEEKAIAEYIPQLVKKARSCVRDLDPTNDLTFFRLKAKTFEVMVAPDKDFMLIVIQGPKDPKKDEDN